jgi:hypothetical protein
MTPIGLEGARLHALGFQFRDHRFRLVGGGDIADRDVGAFIGECAGAGRADAARTAGDEGNLACKFLGHGISPLPVISMACG